MENSRLFTAGADLHSAGDLYTLVSGERLERHGAPARAAWEIERLATLRGWPAGESLGSEARLRKRLQVSRETLREAIRIVESRGAGKMRRGRSGGLMLVRPTVERAAVSIAAHLRANGITRKEIANSVTALDQLLAWQLARNGGPLAARRPGETPREWLARASGRQTYQVYVGALRNLAPAGPASSAVPADLEQALEQRDPGKIFEILSGLPFASGTESAPDAADEAPARAVAIVGAIVEHARSTGSTELGNEATLCEDFDTSRPIMRQALRVLQDLDVVEVRLGRGGGYCLKHPSAIGIIRQVFVWLAARNCDPFALNELVEDVNSAILRVAGAKLSVMSAEDRRRVCDGFQDAIRETAIHERFFRLQQCLAEVAACPVAATLARCIVAYQARTSGDFLETGRSRELEVLLQTVVTALRDSEIDPAEQALRAVQGCFGEEALQDLGLLVAPE